MAIQKNSPEYNMMGQLYKLYTLAMEDTTDENQVNLANMQNQFEKDYCNVFGVKDFSHAIESMYVRRIKENGSKEL